MILPDLVPVAGGPTLLGWDQGEPEERPQHPVVLRSFKLARTPVTNLEYLGFMAAGGYHEPRYWLPDGWNWLAQKAISQPAFWGDVQFGQPDQPVVGVSWYEAVAYTAWLAEASRQPIRLPSEAEWERAARGQTGRLWPWGNTFVPKAANVAQSQLGQSSRVGAFPAGATPDGILDLAGNVWEWTNSRWGRAWQTLEYAYPYNSADGREDPTGRYARVMRGGSWFDPWPESRSTKRARYLPGSRASNIGFRVAA